MVDYQKIRELRAGKGIEQKEFAHIIGASETFVSFLERGLKQPTVAMLKRIADYLDVKMDFLVKQD